MPPIRVYSEGKRNDEAFKIIRRNTRLPEILSADLDFTVSENPSFRFYFLPRDKGELRAVIEDSENLVIEQRLEVDPDKVRLN